MRWLALAVLASACSWGDNYHPPDAPPPDTGPDALTFPAFSPEAVQVFKGNGAVMASVRLVPVFYPNDALRSAILTGLANLPASQMWAQVSG